MSERISGVDQSLYETIASDCLKQYPFLPQEASQWSTTIDELRRFRGPAMRFSMVGQEGNEIAIEVGRDEKKHLQQRVLVNRIEESIIGYEPVHVTFAVTSGVTPYFRIDGRPESGRQTFISSVSLTVTQGEYFMDATRAFDKQSNITVHERIPDEEVVFLRDDQEDINDLELGTEGAQAASDVMESLTTENVLHDLFKHIASSELLVNPDEYTQITIETDRILYELFQATQQREYAFQLQINQLATLLESHMRSEKGTRFDGKNISLTANRSVDQIIFKPDDRQSKRANILCGRTGFSEAFLRKPGFIEDLFLSELKACGILDEAMSIRLLAKPMTSPLNDGVHPKGYSAQRIIVISNKTDLMTDSSLVIGLPPEKKYPARTGLWWALIPKQVLNTIDS